MGLNDIPPEVWEVAMRIAAERFALWRSDWSRERQLETEAKRILKEGEAWPLSRCAKIVPYVGWVEARSPVKKEPFLQAEGIYDDGTLRFALAVIWLAPFPAHNVSLDFRCNFTVPDDPLQFTDTSKGPRQVTYSAKLVKVEQPGSDHIDAGSVTMVPCALSPDSPVTAEELGPTVPPVNQTRMGRLMRISGMRISASGPWKCVRDSEYMQDLDCWIPRR